VCSVLTLTGLVAVLGTTTAGSQPRAMAGQPVNRNASRKKLIFSDNFSELDTLKWRLEIELQAGSSVQVEKRKLVLDTKGGVTVWLKQPLRGNLQIEYTRKVIVAGQPNDRLSDLNQFWMASEPAGNSLARRSGKFEEYDNLRMYYVGMGGNTNSTTRFRKYQSNGERTLLQEYTDAAHLLTANKAYKIKTIVQNGLTSFWVDGQCYCTYQDPNPLREGYFGFRSTWSRQEISDFKVYQLD
jgi:rhamnogalacturonan endolyase